MADEKRLIDANKYPCRNCGKTYCYQNCKEFIEWLENTVDAVEVVHGYWIERPLDNFRKYEVKCSECGFIGIGDYDQYLEPIDFYFCPRCGTQMDGLDGDGNA